MSCSSIPASLPPTSVVLCSRNRPKLLLECVQSVLQGEEVPTELIIIDDSDFPHESLGGLTTIRPCEVRYLWTHSVGLSRANNAAIAAARHDVLVFTQDDALVASAWFGTIVRALIKAGRRSVVTGQVLPTEPQTPGDFNLHTLADPVPAVYEGRVNKDILFFQNLAMYRFVVEEVGYFDQRLGPGTSFPGAEDNDFGLRLLEAGYRILHVPEAIVYHRAWRNKRDYFPLRWNYGRAQGAFYAKYLNLQDRYMLGRLGQDLMHYAYMACCRMRREPRRAYGDAVYVLGILSGVIQWLLTQRRTR
jgi:GT2 family glycosyltransferase